VERARIAQIVELIVENDEHEGLDSVGDTRDDAEMHGKCIGTEI
jgi:hypothetical protein